MRTLFKSRPMIVDINKIISTCGFLSNYLENKKTDNKEYKPILDNLLPTCSVLFNFNENIVTNKKPANYKFTLDIVFPTCKFLLGYQNTDQKDYEGSKYTVEDFFPLCTYVVNFKENEDDPLNPDFFCIAHSNTVNEIIK
eukprot:XP_016663443.1 PREDICTED: uncharacterized protein LOC103310511 [Acyrthosiphon pisum]